MTETTDTPRYSTVDLEDTVDFYHLSGSSEAPSSTNEQSE
jgi:hypothetical protein